jgi:hypothetical protein
MVSASLASALAARRHVFNQRVQETRHRMPGFDTSAFAAFVANEINGVCAAVDAIDSASTGSVVEAAFDIGLELVGQGLAGPSARLPWVNLAWQRLSSPAARLIAASPTDALGAMTNAVVRMGSVPGVRVEEWIGTMEALVSRSDTLDSLRSLGAVCAWRAGMAHLRQAALEHADRLDADLASAAVGSPRQPWTSLRECLRAERWWNPAQEQRDLQGRTVGGFSGFGGPFAAPPEVRVRGHDFMVESAGRHFLVIADGAGAVILPASSGEFAEATSTGARQVELTPRGPRIGETMIRFAVPADRMRAVASTDSIALFSPWSHQIRIVPGQP